jgi:hypothetical protein
MEGVLTAHPCRGLAAILSLTWTGAGVREHGLLGSVRDAVVFGVPIHTTQDEGSSLRPLADRHAHRNPSPSRSCVGGESSARIDNA